LVADDVRTSKVIQRHVDLVRVIRGVEEQQTADASKRFRKSSKTFQLLNRVVPKVGVLCLGQDGGICEWISHVGNSDMWLIRESILRMFGPSLGRSDESWFEVIEHRGSGILVGRENRCGFGG